MRYSSRAKIAIRHALGRVGFDLVRSLPPEALLQRRMDLLRGHSIDLLFDVGANAGQYASTMRAAGYEGRIVSFEPSSEAFRLLEKASQRDPGWTAVHCALGDRCGNVTLHISANSQSSSVLTMLPAHLSAAPASEHISDETVEMTTLAHQIACHLQEGERLFVKVDTQGSEHQVLLGAGDRLSSVVGLQLELSLIPLYAEQPLIEDLVGWVRTAGFVPMALEPGFYDQSRAQLLQVDGVFFRPGEGMPDART